MLLQFTVENFLSFHQPATLSMLAAEGLRHDERQLAQGPGGQKVVRCAAIYGANASGKSNFIRALDFALNLMRHGRRRGERIGVIPFKLHTTAASAPSRFEFELGSGERRYSYGFEATQRIILSEWLFVTEAGTEEMLFQRTPPDEKNPSPRFEFGDTLAATGERKQFLKFVAESTRPNQLFFSETLDKNVTELEKLHETVEALTTIWPSSSFMGLIGGLEKDPDFRQFVTDFMRQADTGIESIEVSRAELTAESTRLPREVIEQIEIGSGFLGAEDDGIIIRKDAETFERAHLLVHHRTEKGTLAKFRLKSESDGTRRLLHLVPALYISPKGANFIIDELERSLHPLLTRRFLEHFLRSTQANSTPGQLIFTTHDTNLLESSLLSRDSIWFTEKDMLGASRLYSLAEFNSEQLQRLTENLEQGYLQGRFGAIPYFSPRPAWARED